MLNQFSSVQDWENDDQVQRGAEWGGMMVLLYTIPAGADLKPLMAGMPGDLCQCPHWGYLLRGRVRIKHVDLRLDRNGWTVWFTIRTSKAIGMERRNRCHFQGFSIAHFMGPILKIKALARSDPIDSIDSRKSGERWFKCKLLFVNRVGEG